MARKAEVVSSDPGLDPTAGTPGGESGPGVSERSTPTARRASRILVVDDDPDLLEVMGAMLRAEGYEVSVAGNGPEALDLLSTFRPDLVLLDVGLPGMNGYEICEAIQHTDAGDHVPVVFVTAAREEPDRARAFSVGAAGHLTKPVDYSALLETARVQLRTRETWKWLEAREAVTRLGGGEGRPAPTERPPIGAEGRPLGPESFGAFRSYLLERLPSLTADQRNTLAKLLPDRLSDLMPSLGIADEEIAAHMAGFYGVRFVATLASDRVRLGVLPAAFSRANQVVAVDLPGTGDSFAVVNPFSAAVADALNPFLHLVQGKGIVLTCAETLSGLLQPRVRMDGKRGITQLEEELAAEFTRVGVMEVGDQADSSSGPIVLLINRIIEEAHDSGASDIHLEPAEKEVVVRCRIDGQLRVMHRLRPPSLIKQLVARIKVMAKLNITERRLPQDGRIEFARYSGTARDLDLRVATAPMQYGEKVVMRLLDKNKAVLPLPSLGFAGEHLSLYRRMLETPHGLILHVGPTGSGKSMALYAALNEVRGPRVNVQTIEDPIEYTLPGVNQLLVNSAVGLDFPTALRSCLRQDPDIILVGEMRDEETAFVAVGAALTGHLVLSTLHTNDAPSTVIRLIGMGIQPFILSSVLIAVCAQRLVRRLCPSCKVAIQTPPAWSERHGAGATFFEASRKGCEACEGLGHKGRIGVFELMVPNDAVRAAMVQRELSSHELRRVAIDQGMVGLHEDGMEKAAQGLCSLTDVRTVCGRA